MISYDIYLFRYYSLLALLNRMNDLKVEVKKYYVYKEELFYLKIGRKYRKIIKKNFSDFNIEEKMGFINFFDKLISKPITFISLVLSICLFFNLYNRVYVVELQGDYPIIEKRLVEFLSDNKIKKFSYGVSHSLLEELEVKIKEEFNNDLEFIEIVKEGAIINVNYKKRRKELVIEGKKGSLYASKDGVIKGFEILSGVKNVRLYQSVKKGDLLVSDILVTSDNNSVYIGTIGKVFASTFHYIEVSTTNNMDDASKQAYLLDLARSKVSENINSHDEYIESETILVNDLKNGYMKIYYVLYEDITI